MPALVMPAQGLIRASSQIPTNNDTLPAGYPTPPDMSGWASITVTTNAQLTSEINSATASGKKIFLSANTNDFGAITINNSTAKIAIISNAPPIVKLVTKRSVLDGIDLVVTDFAAAHVIAACIPDGIRAATASNRLQVNNIRADICWIEGVLVGTGDRLDCTGFSTSAFAVNELWLRHCMTDRNDGRFMLNGTDSQWGSRNLISWENFHRADGNDTTGTTGLFTDYGYQLHVSGKSYFYGDLFIGGFNHSISQKHSCQQMRIDDCVFVAFAPTSFNWEHLNLGQEGTPPGDDRTCLLTTINGTTFVGHNTGANEGRFFNLKDTVGMNVYNCMFYSNVDFLFQASPNTTNATTTDSGNLAGSAGFLFEECTFRGATVGSLGTAAATSLKSMIDAGGQWGGYTFAARNNHYSGTRAVSNKSSKVTTSWGPNPGFSG